MKKLIVGWALAVVGIIGFAQNGISQDISPRFFGVNAWLSDTIGDVSNCLSPPCIKYGKLHKHWQKVQESGADIVRYGGISPDKNKPTMYQYLRIVDSCRAKGMEPMLQVPYWDTRYSAADAAAIVNYINVVKNRNVKYWIIANEPNLSYSYTTAAQIATYFKAYASAMKAVDPTIKIVGPETASFKQTITNGLTSPGGVDDICGRDAAGNFYLDVFSFHTYPMHDGLGTRAEALTKLTDPGDLKDDLAYLGGRLAAANTYHNRTGSSKLTMAVTEANIVYTNSPTDDLYGIGANSFFGAQFVCEMYGIGLRAGVDFINLWSVVEGAASIVDNCGYIDPNTGNRKPLYWHFQMMAENFNGTSIDATDNQANVKVFACQNTGGETTVMLMNQDLSSDYSYKLRLNNTAISGTTALKINVNSGITQDHNDVLNNQSTVILVFNSAGTLIKKTEYSLAVQAIANLPPVTTNYGLTTGISDAAPEAEYVLDAVLYPNPSNGAFTIKLASGNEAQKMFHVEMINLLGQVIYDKELEFKEGEEQIEAEHGYAQGTYIVRVRLDDQVITRKIILNK